MRNGCLLALLLGLGSLSLGAPEAIAQVNDRPRLEEPREEEAVVEAGAPENWTAMDGARVPQWAIDWLYNANLRGCFIDDWEGIVFGWCEKTPLTAQERADIAASCADLPDVSATLLCAALAVSDALRDDEEAVCRHHTYLLLDVLERLGFDPSTACGDALVDGALEGHEWVEVYDDDSDTLYVLDAANGIYVQVTSD